ncbi:MAG: TIR domain-containing protein, partial [Anaerolineae bacterium]|nr:TIR domain-containing protein [Anaerolineae bacterium]
DASATPRPTREGNLEDEPTPTPTPLPTASPRPTSTTSTGAETTSIASVSTVTPQPNLTFTPTLPPTITATPGQGQQSSTETSAPPTPSATPLVIAAAGVLVRSEISGEVIGDGTLRLYAPTTLNYPDSATVRVELELNNLYITPTPAGAQGTPPPRVTTTAGEQPTPVPPLITDSGLLIYQRMGATLLCDAAAFRGCDAERGNEQTKLVTGRVTSWSWIIAPEQAASGLQNLRVEVWIVQRNLDGQLEFLDLEGAQYPLQITVNAGGSDALPLIIAALAVAVIAGAGWFILRGRLSPAAPPVQQPKSARPAPLVFISYRRGTSWGQARSIEQNLRQRGANTFIDIDDINEGRFAETIQHAIEQCDYFVPILAPGTLDSVWVRKEIMLALENRKIIVPLLVDGFKLDEGSLPDEVRDIASHNAITLLPEFYEEALDRLAERFLRLGDKGR